MNARQWKDSATSPLDLHGSNIRKISMKLGQENEDTQVLIKTNQGFVVRYPSSSVQRNRLAEGRRGLDRTA